MHLSTKEATPLIRSWLNLCLAVLTTGGFYTQQAVQGGLVSAEPAPSPDALSGSYAIQVEQYDWGAGVSQVLLTLEKPAAAVSPEQFLVVEEKQSPLHSSPDIFQSRGELTITRTPRTVTAAYLCTREGKAVNFPSQYVTLELAVSPEEGSPLCFHPEQQHYRWAQPYQLAIELAPGETITAGVPRVAYPALAISRTPTARSLSLADSFTFHTFTGQSHTLPYASFTPQHTQGQKPRVVWLHGLGEGGSDPAIPLLGNRSTFFATPQFQSLTDGAYVLIPQCPTFWMDDGTGQNTAAGKSCYTADLMALIQSYLAAHPGVDPSRVYVGGCSNGGYMTMELLLNCPGFFAAAFPVCQAYEDDWISDQQLSALASTPIWFVHSEGDAVCPPHKSTFPTVERLRQLGAAELHLTRLGEISSPEQSVTYNPHYSWVPVLSGQVEENGLSLFSWLTRQALPTLAVCPPEDAQP